MKEKVSAESILRLARGLNEQNLRASLEEIVGENQFLLGQEQENGAFSKVLDRLRAYPFTEKVSLYVHTLYMMMEGIYSYNECRIHGTEKVNEVDVGLLQNFKLCEQIIENETKKGGSNLMLAIVNDYLGLIQRNLGHPSVADRHFQKAESVADLKWQGYILFNRGRLRKDVQMVKKATEIRLQVYQEQAHMYSDGGTHLLAEYLHSCRAMKSMLETGKARETENFKMYIFYSGEVKRVSKELEGCKHFLI
jgi:hypothetical protein